MRPKFVFVFGSNDRGVHGGGAAAEAANNYGAVEGVGEGPTGNAYAIPTKKWVTGRRKITDPKDDNYGKWETYAYLKTMPYNEVEDAVETFITYARRNQDTIFFVTPIGCGLAGMDWKRIKGFFKSAPDNCVGPFFY